MQVSFIKDKETKGTWRYAEVGRDERDEILLDSDGNPEKAASNLRAIGSLYLSRALRHEFGGQMPTQTGATRSHHISDARRDEGIDGADAISGSGGDA